MCCVVFHVCVRGCVVANKRHGKHMGQVMPDNVVHQGEGGRRREESVFE